jgi:hypothetical protein
MEGLDNNFSSALICCLSILGLSFYQNKSLL